MRPEERSGDVNATRQRAALELTASGTGGGLGGPEKFNLGGRSRNPVVRRRGQVRSVVLLKLWGRLLKERPRKLFFISSYSLSDRHECCACKQRIALCYSGLLAWAKGPNKKASAK